MNNNRRRKNSNNLKNKNFIEAFINAVSGIVYGFKTQRNLKIQLVIAIIVILIGVRLELNKTDFIVIIFSIMFVFVTLLGFNDKVMKLVVQVVVTVANYIFSKFLVFNKDI